jgi:hypothetical protein
MGGGGEVGVDVDAHACTHSHIIRYCKKDQALLRDMI